MTAATDRDDRLRDRARWAIEDPRVWLAWQFAGAAKVLMGIGHRLAPNDVPTESQLVNGWMHAMYDYGREAGRRATKAAGR